MEVVWKITYTYNCGVVVEVRRRADDVMIYQINQVATLQKTSAVAQAPQWSLAETRTSYNI